MTSWLTDKIFSSMHRIHTLRALVYCMHILLFIRYFWISDDGVIFFRVVENFLDGNGLSFNANERVNPCTSVFWTIYLIPFVYVFEYLGLSIMTSSLVFLVLTLKFMERNLSEGQFLTMSFLLGLSNVFLEFSSSGLETPAVFFFSLCFALFASKKNFNGYFYGVCFLMFMTRMDMILLIIPSILGSIKAIGFRRFFVATIHYFLLAILWFLFSLFYYGWPLPNTFYAKITPYIDASSYFKQGTLYLFDFFLYDPVSSLAMILGIAYFLTQKQFDLFLGMLLHILYILKVGGDFMTGRFFSAETILGIYALTNYLSSYDLKTKLSVAVISTILSLTSGASLHLDGFVEDKECVKPSGVAFERKCYRMKDTGWGKESKAGIFYWKWEKFKNQQLRSNVKIKSDLVGTLGRNGFKNPLVRIRDIVALSDPFLARLPISPYQGRYFSPQDWWRSGHLVRLVPIGYYKSLVENQNYIAEESLAKYYDIINFMISGPLWNYDRVKTAISFNFGKYDHLLLPIKGEQDLVTSCDKLIFDERLLKERLHKHGMFVIKRNNLKIQCNKAHLKSIIFVFVGDLLIKFFKQGHLLAETRAGKANSFAKTLRKGHYYEFNLPININDFDEIILRSASENHAIVLGLKLIES